MATTKPSVSIASTKQLQHLIAGYIRESMKSINQILPIELIDIVYCHFNTLFDHIELQPIDEITEWIQQLNEESKSQIIQTYSLKLFDALIEIPQHLQKPSILSAMINRFNIWKYDINSILERNEPYIGTLNSIQKQKTFWTSKQTAIKHIESQLKTTKICASILVLHQNDFAETVSSFVENSKLKQITKEIESINGLLSVFPHNTIMKSTSVTDLMSAINEIFTYLEQYNMKNIIPFKHSNQLIHISANDIASKLKEILGTNIMNIEYNLFLNKINGTDRMFHQFHNKYLKIRYKYTNTLKPSLLDQARYNKYLKIRRQSTDTELNTLQRRMQSINNILKAYHESKPVICATFECSNKAVIKQIISTFDVFGNVDVLNCKQNEWDNIVKEYETKMKEIENEIYLIIKNELENAESENEIFLICQKYNSLFIIRKISDIVMECSDTIINYAKQKMNELQLQYENGYPKNSNDTPNICDQVLWLRQLNDKLDNINEILKWIHCSDSDELNHLRRQLDPKIVIKHWDEKAKALPVLHLHDKESIFRVDKNVNGKLSLHANFDEKYSHFKKEVKGLESLKIRVDIGFRFHCIDIKIREPIVGKLKDAMVMFNQICTEMDGFVIINDEEKQSGNAMNTLLPMLVERYKYKCQVKILNGVKLRWQNHEKQLIKYANGLCECVSVLYDNFKMACDLTNELDKILNELISCPVMNDSIDSKMKILQTIVDKLTDEDFYGVMYWTAVLNDKLENIFAEKMEKILDEWANALDHTKMNDMVSMMQPVKNIFEAKTPICNVRVKLIENLYTSVSIIIDQPKLKVNGLSGDLDTDNTFKSILNRINIGKVIKCYKKIEILLSVLI